jgi:hypothetical protein
MEIIESMNLIINDKEIIFYLTSLIDYTKYYKGVPLETPNTNEAIEWSLERKTKLHKFRDKIKEKIYLGVKADSEIYVKNIMSRINEKKVSNFNAIKYRLDHILEKIGEEKIIAEYHKSDFSGFCKNPGLIIDPNAIMIRRQRYKNTTEDCIIRNTVGNESSLTVKIDNNHPFWFIDSGYTNFLGSTKKWHRLVRNHLHFNKNFEAPVDRLGMFESFPAQWREGGDRILVIEPGPFAAAIFHVDIKQWRLSVEEELRKYTDKKIIFREKAPKKKRAPLYKHLCYEDYFCVISINSNAATESIWSGIPVITLDKHITNPVSRNKLSDINNLYRGSLSNWLSTLSYSQFTYDEIVNGKALEIVKQYHV